MRQAGTWFGLRRGSKRRGRGAPAGATADAGDVLAPGVELEEFVIERVLGAGGFAVTYLARDVSLDAWRAVKEYLPREWGRRRNDGSVGPRSAANAEDYRWGLERFLKEARVLAQFDHRCIVRVHRVFESQGTAYLVMEYVEGRSLAGALNAAGGALPDDVVREVLLSIADGLAAVHRAGSLHRDIKPDNVMLRRDGTPVLIDFGAARQLTGRGSRPMTALVTAGYAPIEQYSSRGQQGPWTDIYALGAVAYVALSGQVPDEATERVHTDRLPPIVDSARQPVHPGLAAAVDAALAVDAAARPQTVDDWRRMLGAAKATPPPEPPASPAPTPRSDAGNDAVRQAAAPGEV